MSQLPKLRKQRQEILGHIVFIEEMRRGSVTRQFLKIKHKGLTEPVLIGPYALYTCKKKGKTLGRRLRDPEEIRRLENQVENYHVFRRLSSELVDVSEQICDEREKERR
jgi:hypothetical protein